MRRFTWFNATSLTLGFAFLYLPMVILVIYSFNDKSLLQDRPVPERHKFLFHIFAYRCDQFDALIQQFS